ncbi:MAG: hypothetical protein HYY04_10385 [Chloroflexi bacterium]|nr:hypothetical protein [Chloroflexota bacterium]
MPPGHHRQFLFGQARFWNARRIASLDRGGVLGDRRFGQMGSIERLFELTELLS